MNKGAVLNLTLAVYRPHWTNGNCIIFPAKCTTMFIKDRKGYLIWMNICHLFPFSQNVWNQKLLSYIQHHMTEFLFANSTSLLFLPHLPHCILCAFQIHFKISFCADLGLLRGYQSERKISSVMTEYNLL